MAKRTINGKAIAADVVAGMGTPLDGKIRPDSEPIGADPEEVA